MKKLFNASLIGVMLMTSCAKDEQQPKPVNGANQTLMEKGTANFTSRISATQSVTLTITKDPNTSALTVSKTVNAANADDQYLIYIVGLTADINSEQGTLTIPNSGSYYFIPFDDTQNAMSLYGGTVIVYKCECCPTGQTGGAGGCSLSGAITGTYTTVQCNAESCSDCGLTATERPVNKTGVYLGGSSVTLK